MAKTTKTATATKLDAKVATPMATGPRQVAPTLAPTGMTPAKVASILRAGADFSDTPTAFELMGLAEDRDPHLRSVISTRKHALAGTPLIAEAAGQTPRDAEVQEAVQAICSASWMPDTVLDISDGDSKGLSVSEITWEQDANKWLPVGTTYIDPRWFEIDKVDGYTVRLRDGDKGSTDLPPHKFLVHRAHSKTGSFMKAGWLYTCAGIWALKSQLISNLTAEVERGGAVVTLRYPDFATEEEIAPMRAALDSLGRDARAMLPESWKLEVQQTGMANPQLYTDALKWCDEQESKTVLGATLLTDSGGGSFAQSKTHSDIFADLLRAGARGVAATIHRDLITPFVKLNYGEDALVPNIRFQIEEPEDTASLVDSVTKLVPFGLSVDAAQLASKLGLHVPEDGATLLVAPAPAAPMAFSMQPSTHSRQPAKTGLDDLGEAYAGVWQRVAAPVMEQMRTSLDDVADKDEAKAALLKAIEGMDMAEVEEVIAAAIFSAKAVGQTGGAA